MKLPNSLFRLLGGLLVLFLFSSCSSAWYMAGSGYNNDPIYGIVESTGDTLKINVLDSEWDIQREFRSNWDFRWNYSLYAQNQPYIWHSDFYYRNRLWRNGFSHWDFYWNRHDIWWNWAQNYPFNYWNHWNNGWFGYGDPFYYGYRYNPYRWYYPNNWFRYNQGIAYNFRKQNQNISYNIGRRGSNGITVTPNGSRGNGNNIIANPNIRINRGRGSDVVLPRNYRDIGIKPNPNDVDVVIEKPNRTFIGRLFDKIENSNVRVRTYENPNNVPNNIRNNNNNWNNRVVPRQNNNVIRNYNTPPRTSSGVRSSSPPVINRGSSSGGAVISRGSSSRRNNID